MIQEAINTLVELLEKYPATCKIDVVDKNGIYLFWNDEITDEYKSKEFSSAIELLEWMEGNLKNNKPNND